jgi:hypothetical protein
MIFFKLKIDLWNTTAQVNSVISQGLLLGLAQSLCRRSGETHNATIGGQTHH